MYMIFQLSYCKINALIIVSSTAAVSYSFSKEQGNTKCVKDLLCVFLLQPAKHMLPLFLQSFNAVIKRGYSKLANN